MSPSFPLTFPLSPPPLPSTQLLLALKKGRFCLAVVTSEQIYMDSWLEKTNFSPKHTAVKVPGGRRNFFGFQKHVIRRASLVLSAIWLNCWSVNPPISSPPKSGSQIYFFLYASQWIKASTLVFLEFCLLPWSCTNFCCPRSCWSIEVEHQPAGVSRFSWCFSSVLCSLQLSPVFPAHMEGNNFYI